MAINLIKTSVILLASLFHTSLQASAMDTDESVPEGAYQIKNVSLSSVKDQSPHIGLLACAVQESSSGVYDAEILDGKADKDSYLFKEGYRDSLLWDMRKVQQEGETYYTIRNCAHKGGFLTLAKKKAAHYGYWCRVVSDDESEAYKTGQWTKGAVESFIPYGKFITLGTGWVGETLFGTKTFTEGVMKTTETAWPFRGNQENHETRYPLNFLWKISKAENGRYTLRNRGEEVYKSDLGILSCATTLLPGEKRALVLHNFPGIAYTEEYRQSHDVDGALRAEALWELSLRTVVEGGYIISSSLGKLFRSATASSSGYCVELLKGDEAGQSLEEATWEIRKAQDEGEAYYTIRNRACSGEGWLTWARDKSSMGYRLQVLADNKGYLYNAYPGDKAKYEPNGRYRKDILWKITQVEEGKFILKNIGAAGLCQFDSGVLGCGVEASCGGQYAHLLWNAPENGGDSIIWELALEKGKESA